METDRTVFAVKTATGSDSLLYLHPIYDYSEMFNRRINFTRTQGGRLNSYRMVERSYSFTVPLDVVSASIGNMVNSWWENNVQVDFVVNSVDAYRCSIDNIDRPFQQYTMENDSNGMGRSWRGIINLTTVGSF